MPPKKRDKPLEEQDEHRVDQIQTDHELFLQSFEKPTQIYRYLRTRHLLSPIFLNRTLTYMRHRMSRAHAKRKSFRVDNILPREEGMKRDDEWKRPSGHMTLTFTGFYDRSTKGSSDMVTIEACLLKTCHKKRKDSNSPFTQISVGKCEVPRNPDPNHPPSKVMAISIPKDSFSLSNGHLVKSYVLFIRVHEWTATTQPKNRHNGMCNGDLSDTAFLTEEPPQKKRRNGSTKGEDSRNLGAELVVFDKQQRCLLSDGQYQLVLKECLQRTSPKKMSTWEAFEGRDRIQSLGPFDVFNKGPLVTFYLTWSESEVNGLVDLPKSLLAPSEQSLQNELCSLHSGAKSELLEKQKRRHCIYYQFLYNNNTRQQTEARDDLHCPWCSLNCCQLYSLLKHLKLCHNRFLFSYVPHPKGARIDVSLNELYDGSYMGNPQGMHSHSGFTFSRNGPVRRTPVTHIMVCRPKRLPPSLSEFLEPDDVDVDGPRPYIFGHNRLYYHTCTCLPIQPQEIDIDSEAENDPGWLRIKTQHMIDEFTDVNEGEKELMKMWNLHIMKYGYVGDCQIPLACSMFVEQHGHQLYQKNLYQNFVLHLTNLFDFGLITASVVYATIFQLQQMVAKS